MDNSSEKLIELTVRRKDFEDIYFSTSERNVYNNPHVRVELIVSLSLAFVFLVSLFYSISQNSYVALTFMSFFFLLFTASMYSYKVYVILKRKKSVNQFLDRLTSINKHSVLLTDQAICLTQDVTVSIEKWSTITNATLFEEYISFEGKQTFLFPKKSMIESDFEYFTNLVKEKVTNG